MNGIKAFGRVTSSGLFKLSLLLFAILLPVVLVFGKADTIKQTLQGSGIYSSAIDSALDSATKNASKDNSLPFDDPQVRAVVKKAVPPEQIQSWSEQIIDSLYKWLNGSGTNPPINLDFSAVKQNLAGGLGDYAVARAKTLPMCTTVQLRQLQAEGGKLDALKAVCVPKGFDIESLRATVQQEVLGNSDFLSKTSVTAADLPKNEQGKTVFEQASITRTVYQWAKITPYIWAGLAIVSAGILFALHDKRRRGLYVIGRTFVGVGIFIVIAGVVTRYLISQATSPTGIVVKQVHGDFQSTVIFIAKNLGNDLNNTYLYVGVAYMVLGALVLHGLHLTKPKTPATDTKETTDDHEAQDAVKASTALQQENTAEETDGKKSEQTPNATDTAPNDKPEDSTTT